MPDEMETSHPVTEDATSPAAATGPIVNKELSRVVRGEVARQIHSLSLSRKIWGEFLKAQQGLKLHHMIAYGTMVFLGVMLLWYGTWGIIATIPVLKGPPVALAAGIGLLALLGALYGKLTG